jgi:hypothetical protein
MRPLDRNKRRPGASIGRARQEHGGHAPRGELDEEFVSAEPFDRRGRKGGGRRGSPGEGRCRNGRHGSPSEARACPSVESRGSSSVVAMRSLALVLAVAACAGGQSTREAARAPNTAPTIPAASSSAEAGAPTPSSPSSSGVAAASASADAAPPPKPPHTHDPGRGIDDLNAIVKAHRDEARACYDKALADHPGIEGDLVIAWTIDPTGKVTQTSLDVSRSTIAEPSVVACVSTIIMRIQFAPSPGGFETKASFPFNFHPHHVKPAQ